MINNILFRQKHKALMIFSSTKEIFNIVIRWKIKKEYLNAV